MVVERGHRVDAGRGGSSSKEPLAHIVVVIELSQDGCRTGAEGKRSALIMTGKSIGRSGRGSNNPLEGQDRLVRGWFAWRSGSWPEKGGVGRSDPERRTGASRQFALSVEGSIVGHASKYC